MRGRPPKPTHLKLIEGNPGKRKVGTPLPVAPTIPTPPDFLDDLAQAEWRRLAPQLCRLGILTGIDRGALAALCQAYGRWQRAERALAEIAERDGVTHGLLVVGRHKTPIQNPIVGIARRAMSDYVRFAAEFGMTPSARSRIEAGPWPVASKFDGLLGVAEPDEPA